MKRILHRQSDIHSYILEGKKSEMLRARVLPEVLGQIVGDGVDAAMCVGRLLRLCVRLVGLECVQCH